MSTGSGFSLEKKQGEIYGTKAAKSSEDRAASNVLPDPGQDGQDCPLFRSQGHDGEIAKKDVIHCQDICHRFVPAAQ
jgi:hypothetical protein